MFIIPIFGLFFLLQGNFGRPQQDFRPPFPPHHRHHGPFLPFLRNLTRDEIGQFFRIVSNGNETKTEIKNDLTNWAQQVGVTVRENADY